MNPHFSADGQRVYFEILFAVVTNAVMSLEIDNRRTSLFAIGSDVRPVLKGRYKGDVALRQRRLSLADSIYYGYWLLDPSGHEVGYVGPDESDVDQFFEASEREHPKQEDPGK